MAGGGGGKSDMERIGLFSEMGYTTIGDKYPKVHLTSLPFNDAAYKSKQMLPGGSKTRSATQAGYFEKEFKRILEKEAYSDPVKIRRQERIRQSKKNIGKAFVPNAPTKLPSGLGSSFGTFAGPVQAFSPVNRPRKAYTAPGKNVMTNPGKKGTGYGYVNVLLGKQQEHAVEAYGKAQEIMRVRPSVTRMVLLADMGYLLFGWNTLTKFCQLLQHKQQQVHKSLLKGGPFKLNMHPRTYFHENPFHADRPLGPPKKAPPKLPVVKPFKPSSPAKKIGGAKLGTFDPYPSHSNDPYIMKQKKGIPANKFGKLFHPSSGPKTAPTRSIVTQNVVRTMNQNNYKTAQGVMAF